LNSILTRDAIDLLWTRAHTHTPPGLNVSAVVNGEQVASAAVLSAGGMVALTSSWDEVEFDNFTLASSNTTKHGDDTTSRPLKESTPAVATSTAAASCDNASLSGVWVRTDTTGVLAYKVVQVGSNASTREITYNVTSAASGQPLQDATIVQGVDYAKFTAPEVTPAMTYGRVQGEGCAVLRWQ
jgi:hypothetical protein